MPHRSLMQPSAARTQRDAGGRGLSSRHFLKLIEDTIDVGLWSADIACDTLEGSVGFYRVMGLDPSVPLTFALIESMMHPDDHSRHGPLLALLRSGQAVQREFRIVRPDRTQRWISSRTEVVLGSDHRPRYALGLIKDVTVRHEALRSVALEHDRFTALLAATAAVVWITTPDGRAQDMPQWKDLTGQSYDEMQGDGWLDAVHPDDVEGARRAWHDAVRQGSTYNTDYRVRCRDGTYRWFNARGVPIRNRDGSVREWIGVCLGIADGDRPNLRTPLQRDGTDRARRAPVLTAAQIRAARGMINLSAEELARRAGISVATVRRLEDPNSSVQGRLETLQAIRKVLEQTGAAFTDGTRPGVQPA